MPYYSLAKEMGSRKKSSGWWEVYTLLRDDKNPLSISEFNSHHIITGPYHSPQDAANEIYKLVHKTCNAKERQHDHRQR